MRLSKKHGTLLSCNVSSCLRAARRACSDQTSLSESKRSRLTNACVTEAGSTVLPNDLLLNVALPASRTRRKQSFFSSEMIRVAVMPLKHPVVVEAGFPVHENPLDLEFGLPLQARGFCVALDHRRDDTAWSVSKRCCVPSRLLASHSYPSSGSSRPALSQSWM